MLLAEKSRPAFTLEGSADGCWALPAREDFRSWAFPPRSSNLSYDVSAPKFKVVEGGWIQTDPLRFGAGDYNLYRYCYNAPINSWDPLGLVNLPQGSGVGPLNLYSDDTFQPTGLPKGNWKWSPDPENSRGGTWKDSTGRSASWDACPKGKRGKLGKPHWDLDDGKGNRSRVDESGKDVSIADAHPPEAPDPIPENSPEMPPTIPPTIPFIPLPISPPPVPIPSLPPLRFPIPFPAIP